MASFAYGITVTLPSGSVSEVSGLSVNIGSMAVGYNSNFNPNAGTATVTSFDNPGSTIGTRGSFEISGSNFNYSFSKAYVESVDANATTGGVVTYSTTIRLVTPS